MSEKNVDRSGSWRATSRALEGQFRAENVLVHEGHAFEITPHFLAYVQTLVTNGIAGITVFDASGIPCKIDDTAKFLKKLLDRHVEAANTLAMAWAAKENDL